MRQTTLSTTGGTEARTGPCDASRAKAAERTATARPRRMVLPFTLRSLRPVRPRTGRCTAGTAPTPPGWRPPAPGEDRHSGLYRRPHLQRQIAPTPLRLEVARMASPVLA